MGGVPPVQGGTGIPFDFQHHAEVLIEDQNIFVFGRRRNAAYIECFDLDSGDHLFRFSTAN